MLAANRILLVGNDPALVHTAQGLLRRAADRPALTCRFGAVHDHVGPRTDGVVVLLAGQPADAEAARFAAQELQLMSRPVKLVLMASAAAGDLGPWADGLSARLPWPDANADLVEVLRPLAGTGVGFHDPARESLEQRIARKLLAFTPSLADLVESLVLAAAHDVTVLLDGETGTGKTYLAKLIHDCSPRRDNRFLVVPCGALAPNLIESEFFGHAKGAFTGADAAKGGKFAAVGAGTLFLDEIDSLSLEHQANLLRVIETGEFEPVGSNETQICAARIVVATNRHLEDAVQRGAFRQDLFYRLNVVPFYLSPLRDRPADIAPLVRGLVARFATKFRKELSGIDTLALRAFEAYPWPGNIRQLENVAQQAVLLCGGPELQLRHLPAAVRGGAAGMPRAGRGTGLLFENREAAERNAIQRALENAGYNRTMAARALGVSRVTLHKKMNKYGLSGRPGRPQAVG